MCRLKTFAVIACFFVTALAGYAQNQPPPFLTGIGESGIIFVLLDPPRNMKGFVMERKGPADNDFVNITPQMVTAVKDPVLFRNLLGEDYDWVARTVKAEHELQTLRRISSPGNATALSLASLKVARALGRLFVDENVEQNRSYEYRLTLLDYNGAEIKSVLHKIRVRPQKVRMPAKVGITSGDGRVDLTWTYPAFKGQPDDNVVGFNIYRRTDGEWHKINRVLVMRQDEKLNWTDYTVENGMNYAYQLTSQDVTGTESQPTKEVTAIPKDETRPFPPRNVKLVEDEGKIALLWDVNMELDLSHYDVYRATSVNGDYSRINARSIPGNSPGYEDIGLVSGPTYFYRVKAVDRSGNVSEFSGPAFGKPKDTQPPGVPSDVAYQMSGRNVRLSWRPPADPDLLGFYIYRSSDNESRMRVVKSPIAKENPTFTDAGITGKGLWPGKSYLYEIAAVDYAYNVGASAQIHVDVVDDLPPEPPLAFWARTTLDGQVRLSWQRSPSTDVVQYCLYRTLSDDEKNPELYRVFADSVRKAVDTDVIRGRKYIYQLAAMDAGKNKSPLTAPKEVIPRDNVAPPPPENVKAVLTGDRVDLTWQAVNADDLVGYNIYRAGERSGLYKKINAEPVSRTSFIDTGGQKSSYYRITSLDSSGKENKNVVSVGVAVKAATEDN